MENRYSIYDAKTHLSEIIRSVKRDRAVIITDRGRDVARVVPIARSEGLEGRLKDLEGSGVLSGGVPSDPGGMEPVARRPGALRRFLGSRSRY